MQVRNLSTADYTFERSNHPELTIPPDRVQTTTEPAVIHFGNQIQIR